MQGWLRQNCIAATISVCAIAALALLVPAASAQAAFTYVASGPFDEGLNQGPNPVGLAVDQSTNPAYASRGDIYVTDGSVVNKFTAAEAAGNEAPESTLSAPGLEYAYGVAVDATTGDVYVTNISGGVFAFNAAGVQQTFHITNVTIQGHPVGIAVDPVTGHLFVGTIEPNRVYELESSGAYAGNTYIGTNGPIGLAISDATGSLYVAQESSMIVFDTGTCHATCTSFTTLDPNSANGVAVDPESGEVFVAEQRQVARFSEKGERIGHSFGSLGEAYGIALNASGSALYVADNPSNSAELFTRFITPDLSIGTPENITATSATLVGEVDPAGGGSVTGCHFEYVIDHGYRATAFENASSVPCLPGTPYASKSAVTGNLSGLVAGGLYHYRLVASNGEESQTEPATFSTGAPIISNVYASEVSLTGAALNAEINPDGNDTTYSFEYGTSAAYGSSAPVPASDIGSGVSTQNLTVHLSGLREGAIYHFRVVATNPFGTTTTEDQTFNFLPPPCPNETLRQQTGSSYLPDCRAYELVSPENAGNVIIFPNGLDAPYATNPARFGFVGGLGAITGTDPPDGDAVDTYVSTRTATGWVTKYVGLKGDEVAAEETLFGNLSLTKFIDFPTEPLGGVEQPPSFAPYVWDSEGNSLGRWPEGVGTTVPDADATIGSYQPSPDFSHLAFSSRNVAFTPNGKTTPPGSAYDYNTNTGETAMISTTAAGTPIEQQPGKQGTTGEYILFPGASQPSGGNPPASYPTEHDPGVSTDGSHILMSTNGLSGVRLYMRVDDSVTYEVSDGEEVSYVGMTSDGSKVFFTSPGQLTPGDKDSSTDLYMWSERGQLEGKPITLLSGGDNPGNSGEPGSTDSCSASWTEKCNVVPIVTAKTGTDSAFATESGEVYFYSPEQLEGGNGVAGEENLYVYRDGRVQFVTSLPPGTGCNPNPEAGGCSNGPLVRMQVTPDGSHMAFVTADQITSYRNDGFQEMYTYTPATGKIVCVSCMPNGESPTGSVEGSEFGLFLTNDGRTFFFTPDALVAQDTNHLHDVYEYVEGRPQLITTGVGSEDAQVTPNQVRPAGLAGASADGVNVYFSTYETLVGQDHNGAFLKFYDARTDGGFPFVPLPAPCAAADECHGAGSVAPTIPAISSNGAPGPSANFPPSDHAGAKHSGKAHRKRRRGSRRGNQRQRRRGTR